MKRSMEASSSEVMPWAYGFISILLLGLMLAVSFYVPSLLGVYAFPYALLPSAIGALLIGVRLRSWRWVALLFLVVTPLVAFGLFFLAVGFLSSAYAPSPMGQGGSRLLALALAETSLTGSALFAIVHALPAAVGVWWGKRREEVDFSPHPVGLGGNASSSEEPVTPARGDARDTGGSQS